jgi:hypothetical protein
LSRLYVEGGELRPSSDTDGYGSADVIDTFTMHPELRRQAVRILAEIDATN